MYNAGEPTSDLSELLDQIESVREELLRLQRALEKMEHKKPEKSFPPRAEN